MESVSVGNVFEQIIDLKLLIFLSSWEHFLNRLVSSVFRLSELEKQMGEAKLAHILSPTLSSTIAWFLQTWSHPYLLFSAVHYGKVSFFRNNSKCI